MKTINFRYAEEKDVSKILFFIERLAENEKMLDEFIATEELLREWIFRRHSAEVLFALDGESEVGFAIFYQSFSTFIGKAGIHLEDLYVLEQYRGRGYGKAIIKQLCKITAERDCARLEWTCRKENHQSIDFYLSLGAVPQDDWTAFRLSDTYLI